MRRDQSHAPAFTLHFSPFDLHFPPTNTLDFQGFSDLAQSLAAPTASPQCELKNSSLKTHNHTPTRFIPLQVMKRSQDK